MFDFLKAAFPWVVIGVAIALFAANHAKTKKQKADEGNGETSDSEKAQENRMTEGMSIGMCLGVMFGTTGVCDLATGISLGMLLGMVVGMSMKK